MHLKAVRPINAIRTTLTVWSGRHFLMMYLWDMFHWLNAGILIKRILMNIHRLGWGLTMISWMNIPIWYKVMSWLIRWYPMFLKILKSWSAMIHLLIRNILINRQIWYADGGLRNIERITWMVFLFTKRRVRCRMNYWYWWLKRLLIRSAVIIQHCLISL